jgi:hypothetical protein
LSLAQCWFLDFVYREIRRARTVQATAGTSADFAEVPPCLTFIVRRNENSASIQRTGRLVPLGTSFLGAAAEANGTLAQRGLLKFEYGTAPSDVIEAIDGLTLGIRKPDRDFLLIERRKLDAAGNTVEIWLRNSYNVLKWSIRYGWSLDFGSPTFKPSPLDIAIARPYGGGQIRFVR